MSYYGPGDEVVYTPKGCGAKVLHALPGDEYIVEFDDRNLIPPQMQVPGQYLAPKPFTLPSGFQEGVMRKPVFVPTKETHCPRCNTQWHETIIGHKSFYDCLKCVLRKEDA